MVVRVKRPLDMNSFKGKIRKGNIVLISDVATSGGSLKEAFEKLASVGAGVKMALVLASRMNEENAKKLGIPLRYALSFENNEELKKNLIDTYVECKTFLKEKEDKENQMFQKAA